MIQRCWPTLEAEGMIDHFGFRESHMAFTAPGRAAVWASFDGIAATQSATSPSPRQAAIHPSCLPRFG
jgi:hypothetical protein